MEFFDVVVTNTFERIVSSKIEILLFRGFFEGLNISTAVLNHSFSFFFQLCFLSHFLNFLDFSEDIGDGLFIRDRNIVHKVIEHVSEVGNLHEIERLNSRPEDLEHPKEVLGILNEVNVHHVRNAPLVVQFFD